MPEDLVVSAELCHGAVVSSLVEVSAHACLLVLHQGRRGTATSCPRSRPWRPARSVQCWWSRRPGTTRSRRTSAGSSPA